MDQHVIDFMKPLSDKKLDEEYYKYLIKRIKKLRNDNVKNFRPQINKPKNKTNDGDKKIFLNPIIFHS